MGTVGYVCLKGGLGGQYGWLVGDESAMNDITQWVHSLCSSVAAQVYLYIVCPGIDCDEARNEEERMMLKDARDWLASGEIREEPHSKTGATALHVAAAKGYINVMEYVFIWPFGVRRLHTLASAITYNLSSFTSSLLELTIQFQMNRRFCFLLDH